MALPNLVNLQDVLDFIKEYEEDQVMSKYFRIEQCKEARATINQLGKLIKLHFEEKK